MNNVTISHLASEIINDTYQATVQLYALVAALAILAYASFLHFPDEVEYMWSARFTLPTYLYFVSKYPVFFFLSLQVVLALSDLSLRLCDNLGYLTQTMAVLPLIGTQGLVAIRTYALCQGYLPIALALSITFLAAVISELYVIFTIPLCSTVYGPSVIPGLIHVIAVIVLDSLAFIVVIHQIWGLWKLKQRLDLRSNQDLAALVLQQGILRFSFVLVIITTSLFLSLLPSLSRIGNDYDIFQDVLSSLLLCEHTLVLRRRNQQKSVPNQSVLNLPTISFHENPVQSIQTALGRLHESIVAEMGERNEPLNIDDLGLSEEDSLQDGFHDGDLDHNEALGQTQPELGIAGFAE